MMTPKILVFAGSARKESFNKKLAAAAAKSAELLGAMVTVIDLADFPLPLFDEDVESAGTPENAQKLKQLFVEHHGFIISSPEYNSSISPLLKNTIDWVSRPAEGEPRMVAYTGKVAALLSASPGGLGGLRGLVHVRSILSSIGVIVIPDQFALSSAHEHFGESGELNEGSGKKRLNAVVCSLTELASKLHA